MPVTSPMIQFVPKLRPDLIARRRPVWRAPLCVHEARRAFAVHHPNQASKAGVGQKMDFLPNKRQNIQESPKVQQKKGVRGLKDASKIPADLGLMPDTFVMPTGKNLPSIFTEPKFRLSLEWRRTKRRVLDTLIAFLIFKWRIYSNMRPDIPRPDRPKINILTIKPAALRLHKQMYTAYAMGDRKALEDICTEGVRETFLTKIEKRIGNSEVMNWELVSYKGRAKLCSMKAGAAPIELNNIPIGIQQAVVRIKSMQRLTIGTEMGAKAPIVWKEPKEKVVTEYFVIQRRLLAGKYEPWKAWGFVKELDTAAERRRKDEILKEERRILSESGVFTPR